MELWNNEIEIKFFRDALESFASPEQLFYKLCNEYFAYIPKGRSSDGYALQSRNSLIGQYTEKWVKEVLSPIAESMNLSAVNGVICDEIGLTSRSSADLAFCINDGIEQSPESIKIIFEIKMSIVSNYSFDPLTRDINFIGDYRSHKGNPSILRSDSMLKAIGKSINIRVSGNNSRHIPIIVIGNTPITDNYKKKVDYLKNSGVVQGFWSLNPKILDLENKKNHNTEKGGFITIEDLDYLKNNIKNILDMDMNYFSSMIGKNDLGNIISLANTEQTDILKAEKFLSLING